MDKLLGTIVRHLVDNELATVREIEEITGRGTSTVYRWIKGEGVPQYGDLRALVRGLEKPEARKVIVSLLASDLPVVVSWADDLDPEAEAEAPRDGQDVIAKSLLALQCLTDVLSEEHGAVNRGELTAEGHAKMVELIDATIRYLTISRTLLARYGPAARRAADDVPPPPKPSSE